MAEDREEYLSRKTGQVRKRRSDGWTRRDIETFLAHLRMTGNIGTSAAAAGKSGDAAHNLREVDAEFDALVTAALDRTEERLEQKVALFAETGGKVPPPATDGAPAEAPLEHFDPHLALAYLSWRRAKREGRGRGNRGPQPKTAGKEELVQAVGRLILMVKRRWAKQQG